VFFNSAYDHVLGTSLGLKIGTASRVAADRAQLAALKEIDRLSRILSSWDAKSEFSQWARSEGQAIASRPSCSMSWVLFDQWRVRTNGAIDPAAQAVIAAWTSAAERQRTPTSGELATALGLVRQPHWRLNMADGTATRLSKTPLVLASFTKSYIMDRAVTAAMEVSGIDSVVLNLGGDLIVRGLVTEPIDIVDPKDTADNGTPLTQILVRDRAVATSGDYRRGVDINGVHYSHIVDPRTGMPAGDVISSTVVAKNPADAGALATAFSILTPAESQQLAASMPGVDYLLVEKNGTRTASCGWNQLEAAARNANPAPSAPAYSSVPAPASLGAVTQASWDPTMELAIDFEIPQLGGGALRPFIAVWIEGREQVSGADARTLVPRGSVPHGVQVLVPRGPPAPDVGDHVDRPHAGRRHETAGQVLVQVGRQGPGGQLRESRQVHGLCRVVARARHVSDRSPGDDVHRQAAEARLQARKRTGTRDVRLQEDCQVDRQTPTCRRPHPRPQRSRGRGHRIKRGIAHWSRVLHTYLSMVSFSILLFFAVTGITLNHQGWFNGEPKASRFTGTPRSRAGQSAAGPRSRQTRDRRGAEKRPRHQVVV
jgi:thiamine biosynthesis lipoprotein ApbE